MRVDFHIYCRGVVVSLLSASESSMETEDSATKEKEEEEKKEEEEAEDETPVVKGLMPDQITVLIR